MADRSLSVHDRRAWEDPVLRVHRVGPGSGLACFPLAHAGRCIRHARSRLDPAELRGDRDSLPVERVRRLVRVQDLVHGLVDRLARAECCLDRARLRVERRDLRRVLDRGAADRGTRRAKKAR